VYQVPCLSTINTPEIYLSAPKKFTPYVVCAAWFLRFAVHPNPSPHTGYDAWQLQAPTCSHGQQWTFPCYCLSPFASTTSNNRARILLTTLAPWWRSQLLAPGIPPIVQSSITMKRGATMQSCEYYLTSKSSNRNPHCMADKKHQTASFASPSSSHTSHNT